MSASSTWTLVQIAELVRRAEQVHLATLRLLGPDARAEALEDVRATLGKAEVEEIKSALVEGHEIAEQLRDLAERLPDEAVELSHAALSRAAAADLALGMLDESRAVVAARILTVRTGWPALAEGLRALDVRVSWQGLTPRGLLAEFRGADKQLVARALRAADISPTASFHELPAHALTRLAAAVDDTGRAWRPS